jgi:hypothetical protein
MIRREGSAVIVNRRNLFAITGGGVFATIGLKNTALAALRGIDHLTIMFKELEPAIQGYRDLGFTVVPGGELPAGTHNAIVAFEDGSYFELAAFKRANDQHRWWAAAQSGGGFIDFSAVTDDLIADVEAFRRAGVNMTDPAPGGRVRPDGYKLSWLISFAPKPFLFQVPLLLQDHTPRAERIGNQNKHPNGVTGIVSITVATDDVARLRSWWSPVLGQPGTEIQRPDIDAAGIRFIAGPHAFEFVAPKGASSPLNVWLKTHGPSPYGIILKTSGGRAGTLDESKANARITLV